MKLRDYQKKQLSFLQSVDGVVKGLQSPTGTGKSIVLLSYIKDCIEKEKHKTIVLTTGFNELVFQMKEDSIKLGLNPKVIIGSGHLVPNCIGNISNYPDFEFVPHFVGNCSRCDPEGDLRLATGYKCSKKCIMSFLEKNNSKFIITNHSYYLAMKDYIKADLVLVDEAHTFGDFYMSYNTISLNKKEAEMLNDYCEKTVTPTSKILAMALRKGMGLNEKLLKNVLKELEMTTNISKIEINEIGRKLDAIFTKKAFDNYLETSNGEYIKTKFFSKYDLSIDGKIPEVIITSATLDKYTLKMFGCENKNQIYCQKEDRTRYKGSNFISCYEEYRDSLSKVLELITKEKDCRKGLILCTSNENVRWTIEELKSKFQHIDVYEKPKDFKNSDSEFKVLVGSKKFYQGVDIPELNYVILDRLPFSVYDDKFQAYSYYIEKVTKTDAWTGYSLPLMFNSLLQGIGRLWRKNDIENSIYDQGTVVIFDPRLEKKFNYIEERMEKMKPGINIIRIMSEEKKKEKEEEENIPKPRKRRRVIRDLMVEEFESLMNESLLIPNDVKI